MLSLFRSWLQKRRQLRALWKADAQELIARDERNAYYTAQRLAARSRAIGDPNGFLHWAKVAAEVARSSAVAEMDYSVVQSIVREECARNSPSAKRSGA